VDASAWGVRLERVGGAVIVSPSGELTGRSVDRLREIVRSREPGLELLVLDLRDLVALGDDGMDFLVTECSRSDGFPHELAIVAGPLARRALRGEPRCDGLALHDDAEAALAPHRERHRARRAAR
jgi:hypothetical protein